MDIYGMGIESSCDETGVAILKNGKEIITNPLFSQIEAHRLYGGVVPEHASRMHLEKMPAMLKKAMGDFQTAAPGEKISYVAVTTRPGLVGSLLMGYNAALAMSHILDIPVIPIHHLEAHFYAAGIQSTMPEYPFLGLLLSGGNSSLYLVQGPGEIELTGDTFDDAAGEALDKAASLLGLPYPGGPSVEIKARDYRNAVVNPDGAKNPFPRILKSQPSDEFNFSFSGLKTSLLYLKRKNPDLATEEAAYYYQERIIEIIIRNLRNAVLHYGIKRVVAAGGVTANTFLREALEKLAAEIHAQITVPPVSLCTDNGAMVAALGWHYYRMGNWSDIKKVSSAKEFI